MIEFAATHCGLSDPRNVFNTDYISSFSLETLIVSPSPNRLFSADFGFIWISGRGLVKGGESVERSAWPASDFSRGLEAPTGPAGAGKMFNAFRSCVSFNGHGPMEELRG